MGWTTAAETPLKKPSERVTGKNAAVAKRRAG